MSIFSVVFNCTEFRPGGPTPNELYISYEISLGASQDTTRTRPNKRKQIRWLVEKPLEFKGSPVPAVFLVCKENRQSAIQAGYELSFRGKYLGPQGAERELWNDRQMKKKGVWVNFQRDVLLFDAVREKRHRSERCILNEALRMETNTVCLLRLYAPEILPKISRLTLGFFHSIEVTWKQRQNQASRSVNRTWKQQETSAEEHAMDD